MTNLYDTENVDQETIETFLSVLTNICFTNEQVELKKRIDHFNTLCSNCEINNDSDFDREKQTIIDIFEKNILYKKSDKLDELIDDYLKYNLGV